MDYEIVTYADLVERYCAKNDELVALKTQVREYLKHKSTDGKIERRELREKLAKAVTDER